jgi:hypothetical protein
MRRRQALASVLLAPAALPVAAQTPPSAPPAPTAAQMAAAAELGADIDIAGEILRELHPGLLRYASQLQVDASMAALKRAFISAPDLAQRYLVLSRFLASLKCGQTYANASHQKPEVARELFERRTRLPFAMRWIGEGMFVTSDSDRLPRGTQIGAINDLPVRTLLRTLMAHVRGDDDNDGQRRALLALREGARLASFDVFQGLLYGEPPAGTYQLDVRTPDGKISRVAVPASTGQDRWAQMSASAPDQTPWDWRVDEPTGVAVLTMRTWDVDASRWDWRAWLGERLDTLGSDPALRGLVLDLRGNEGGLDCGDPILQRFLARDSVLPVRRLVRYRKTPPHLDRYLEARDESVRDWGARATKVDDRFFELPAADLALRPRGPRIAKPLVVLTDGANGAASFVFLRRVRGARAGRLVGETSGGSQRGTNGGAFFLVRLPTSGLEFDLPLVGNFGLPSAPDAGIEPDLKIDPDPLDLAAGIDMPLQRGLLMARG